MPAENARRPGQNLNGGGNIVPGSHLCYNGRNSYRTSEERITHEHSRLFAERPPESRSGTCHHPRPVFSSSPCADGGPEHNFGILYLRVDAHTSGGKCCERGPRSFAARGGPPCRSPSLRYLPGSDQRCGGGGCLRCRPGTLPIQARSVTNSPNGRHYRLPSRPATCRPHPGGYHHHSRRGGSLHPGRHAP